MKGLIFLFIISLPIIFIIYMIETPNSHIILSEFYSKYGIDSLFNYWTLIAFAVLVFYYNKRRGEKIRKAWKSFAYSFGLEYFKPKSFKEMLSDKNAPGIYGTVKGKLRTSGGVDYDFMLQSVTSTHGTGEKQRTSTVTQMSFTSSHFPKTFHLTKAIPAPFGIIKKFRSSMLLNMGHKEYKSDNEEFNSRYQIKFTNDKDHSDLITLKICQQLLDIPEDPSVLFYISNGKLIYAFTKTPHLQTQLESTLRKGEKILDIFSK